MCANVYIATAIAVCMCEWAQAKEQHNTRLPCIVCMRYTAGSNTTAAAYKQTNKRCVKLYAHVCRVGLCAFAACMCSNRMCLYACSVWHLCVYSVSVSHLQLFARLPVHIHTFIKRAVYAYSYGVIVVALLLFPLLLLSHTSIHTFAYVLLFVEVIIIQQVRFGLLDE